MLLNKYLFGRYKYYFNIINHPLFKGMKGIGYKEKNRKRNRKGQEELLKERSGVA